MQLHIYDWFYFHSVFLGEIPKFNVYKEYIKQVCSFCLGNHKVSLLTKNPRIRFFAILSGNIHYFSFYSFKFNLAIGIDTKSTKPFLAQKHARTRIYKILARPTLSNVSEVWTLGHNHRWNLLHMKNIKTNSNSIAYGTHSQGLSNKEHGHS